MQPEACVSDLSAAPGYQHLKFDALCNFLSQCDPSLVWKCSHRLRSFPLLLCLDSKRERGLGLVLEQSCAFRSVECVVQNWMILLLM
eukprot:1154432-Pelagomonas_calceolata.AAC.2